MLVIAHRMRTVEAADKIIVLSDGKVAEEGSPAELFEKERKQPFQTYDAAAECQRRLEHMIKKKDSMDICPKA